MEAFEGDGVFWLPDEPERQVAGHFQFNPTNGLNLQLIGALRELPHSFAAEVEPIRILGFAAGKHLTLEDCHWSGTNIQSPGINRESWRPTFGMAGAHWGAGEALTFTEATVEFDELPAWISLPRIEIELSRTEPTRRVEQISVSLRPTTESSTLCGVGTLTHRYSWGLDGNHRTEATLSQSCSLTLTYPEPQILETIHGDVGLLRDVVTLGSDSPAIMTSFTLGTPQKTVAFPRQPPRQERIEFFRQRRDPAKSGLREEHEMFFTFGQIGGLEGLGKWVYFARPLQSAINSLPSVKYMDPMYTENRFHNVIDAAETLHRLHFPNYVMPADEYERRRKAIVKALPKAHRNFVGNLLQYGNEPRLSDRLSSLLKRLPPAIGQMLGGAEEWSTVVAKVRNRLTHYDPDQPPFWASEDLYWLSESNYLLVLLSLLRICDAPDSAIDQVCSNQRAQHALSVATEVVSRLHGVISNPDNDEEDEEDIQV